jgi:hypothetical protein
MKIDLSPLIILFYGDEGLYWGFVGDALRKEVEECRQARRWRPERQWW